MQQMRDFMKAVEELRHWSARVHDLLMRAREVAEGAPNLLNALERVTVAAERFSHDGVGGPGAQARIMAAASRLICHRSWWETANRAYELKQDIERLARWASECGCSLPPLPGAASDADSHF